MLRKLDLGLNCVLKSEDEIKMCKNEELQKIADEIMERQQLPLQRKNFKIAVPSVEEDFPELGKTKTQIYPLPISHENQCSTVGLASNMDKFSEEFNFDYERNPTYMPMKQSGKEFDLERAYERFAFVKSLERHKEQQANYEKVLRKTVEENAENEQLNDDIVVFVEEAASPPDSEDDY